MIYLHYLKIYFLDQSIQEGFSLILKNEFFATAAIQIQVACYTDCRSYMFFAETSLRSPWQLCILLSKNVKFQDQRVLRKSWTGFWKSLVVLR